MKTGYFWKVEIFLNFSNVMVGLKIEEESKKKKGYRV